MRIFFAVAMQGEASDYLCHLLTRSHRKDVILVWQNASFANAANG
jgi:hypothetical protein